MKHVHTRVAIKNIAAQHNVTAQDAENVINCVFEWLRYVISEETDRDEGYFPTIRIPGFATFYVPKPVQEKWKEINNNKNIENESI